MIITKHGSFKSIQKATTDSVAFMSFQLATCELFCSMAFQQSPFGKAQHIQVKGYKQPHPYQEQKQNNNNDKTVSDEYNVMAHFEDMEITLTVIEGVSKKRWKLVKTQKDFDDIKAMYDRIKVAVNNGKMNCVMPGK